MLAAVRASRRCATGVSTRRVFAAAVRRGLTTARPEESRGDGTPHAGGHPAPCAALFTTPVPHPAAALVFDANAGQFVPTGEIPPIDPDELLPFMNHDETDWAAMSR